MTQKVSKSQFKPHALEYFRKIQESGRELIITDHGKPVLKIAAYAPDPAAALKALRNTVVRFVDPEKPTDESWDALK
jgi:antitoxin (DNA-binding transcriptional repressor) of toxin-antitoxin stability system